MARKTYVVPSINLEMLPIPAGSFLMGSPDSEEGHKADEKQHQVTLTKDFLLGKYPVTQEQWKAVMKTSLMAQFKKAWNSPAKICYKMDRYESGYVTLKEFSRGLGKRMEEETRRITGSNYPILWVSYDEALEFCQRLTEIERSKGHLPEGTIFTLPTEAQWEYACRAKTTGAHAGDLDKMAWYGGGVGENVNVVGTMRPNAWGLYDMHGNIWEWCLDWYDVDYGISDLTKPVTDPIGAVTGTKRVSRGGGWNASATGCRSAIRAGGTLPVSRSDFLGFRIARCSI